jgi:uncharacterized protein (TIGR02145 family)
MTENLKSTHYSDGSVISGVYDYNDNLINTNTHGKLYNWYATMNGSETTNANPSGVQGVCPDGWHVPSRSEYLELANFLGGHSVAGGKMKTTGTEIWSTPNTGATNESSFCGLPSGCRYSDNNYYTIGIHGYFWTTHQNNSSNAYRNRLNYNDITLQEGYNPKSYAFSVRCVKN